MKKIILASASPRRFALLSKRGYEVLVKTAPFDEQSVSIKSPKKLVMALAFGKGKEIRNEYCNEIVISADTIVVKDGKILGKPKTYDEAFNMLSSLSNATHYVYTGVCIGYNGKTKTFVSRAKVRFHPLTKTQIEKYIDSGSPFDKAGSYGVQDDDGIGFVKSVKGELSCVIGLPIGRVIKELQKIKE